MVMPFSSPFERRSGEVRLAKKLLLFRKRTNISPATRTSATTSSKLKTGSKIGKTYATTNPAINTPPTIQKTNEKYRERIKRMLGVDVDYFKYLTRIVFIAALRFSPIST